MPENQVFGRSGGGTPFLMWSIINVYLRKRLRRHGNYLKLVDSEISSVDTYYLDYEEWMCSE